MAIIAKISRAPVHVTYTPTEATWAVPSGDPAPWVDSYSTTGIKLKSGRYRVTQIHGGGNPAIYTSGFTNIQNTRRDVVVESTEVWVYLTSANAPGEVIVQPI